MQVITLNMAGVQFIPPTRKQFDYLLRGPVGGGLGHINTVDFRLRKGGGFFSVLGKLARKAVPYIFPTALKMGTKVVSDVVGGEDLSSSIKKRGMETLNAALKGSTKKVNKRKRTKTKQTIKSVKKVGGRGSSSNLKNDVFDSIFSVG